MTDKTIYEELGEERKQLQAEGLLPEFYTTAGYQILKAKYLDGESPLSRYQTVARTAARHTTNPKYWEERFFQIMWDNWLSPATPVLTNMGKPESGTPVSCSGGYVGDSVYDFYESQKEVAVLSQNGFGTSGYFGDIRPRGSEFAAGGKASGALPVIKDFIQVSRDISQGSNRRGAFASYYPLDGKDFWEIADHLIHYSDDNNVGWVLFKEWLDKMDGGCSDSLKRWQRALKIRATNGKGYLMKHWTAQEQRPQMYKDMGLDIKASQLCTEIMLHSSEDYTYTCVLSSMNLVKWDEWKDTDAVFVATVFLDCVAQEFIEIGKTKKGLEKAIKFTEKSRALGLGVLGYHTMLQDKLLPFGSFKAKLLNKKIFKHIDEKSLEASQWMAEEFGEPDWCKGYGVRNTHRIAIAPTMSTSLLMGGISQGIEPFIMNVFSQTTAGGSVRRINPRMLALMKERGVYSEATLSDIEDNAGSVQHVNWLSDLEKEVYLTAFEINQMDILDAASTRQQFVCQAQSLNLFFDANETEEWISEVMQKFIEDKWLITLYYQRSMQGVKASKGEVCASCQG